MGKRQLGRAWKVSSEQKLMILPRRSGTMCCPAACERSQTDLRFTFSTCACQRSASCSAARDRVRGAAAVRWRPCGGVGRRGPREREDEDAGVGDARNTAIVRTGPQCAPDSQYGNVCAEESAWAASTIGHGVQNGCAGGRNAEQVTYRSHGATQDEAAQNAARGADP